MNRPALTTQDFDLHGIVGLRLVDATVEDIATVVRQIGPLQSRLHREPDVTVRFVDRLPDDGLTYVGLGDTAYGIDTFLVLGGRRGTAAGTVVPFDRIGLQPELLCQHGTPVVPHLVAIINLTALGKGVLPLHASAFTTGDGLGVLVTGWAKGGKTESLLAAMDRGARYVGDEWVYLTPRGEMLGIPEPIRLWAWQLEQQRELLTSRRPAERARLRAWTALGEVCRASVTRRLPGAASLRRGLPIIERQAHLQVPPAELFGADRVSLRGFVDAVVLVMSHMEPSIATRRAGKDEVPGRMSASLEDERSAFASHYRQFCYAFPGRSSTLVESAPSIERNLLHGLFADRPAAVVAHPHPCDIEALGQVVLDAARDVAAPARGEVAAS